LTSRHGRFHAAQELAAPPSAYRKEGLMKTTLLMLLFAAAASPALASPERAARAEPAITCETVRAYVSQVGVVAAKAMARANGMTTAQERRARQCLASRD
jgi:hypothetical protein